MLFELLGKIKIKVTGLTLDSTVVMQQKNVRLSNIVLISFKEKFTWTSENGARITLSDLPLQDLSEIEAKILQRVAIEKINELNIGINVTAPDGQ